MKEVTMNDLGNNKPCEQVAVIFDLDGVLTDTAEYHYQAWRRLAEEEGLTFSREDNEKLRGVSRRASLELILKGSSRSEEKILEMMDRKNNYYRNYIQTMDSNDLLPGALEILKQLRKVGVKLALASASKNARDVVERLSLKDYFEVIADGNSVKRAKPEPDLFLFAAGKLSVSPQCTAVVEDAEAGIEAALAANMATVGIGPPERVGKADLVCKSVAEIDVSDLLSLLPKG
jgi:beta-phosphoglucomutase